MFQLPTPTAVKIAHVNIRQEKHGPDDVLAADVSMHATLPSDSLMMFHPSLRDALYVRPDDRQGVIGDLAQPWTQLLAPVLDPVKLRHKAEGRNVRIEYGEFEPRDAIDLTTCAVNSFVAEPMQGGSVHYKWRVQVNVQPDQVGELAGLLGQTVQVVIAPTALPAENEAQKQAADQTTNILSIIGGRKAKADDQTQSLDLGDGGDPPAGDGSANDDDDGQNDPPKAA